MKEDARFAQSLEALGAAVSKKSGAQVLDALLGAWRVRRLPALTDAIEALSKRYEKVIPPIAGTTERARYEQLLDRVTKKRSVDVASILAELPSATVIRAKDHTDRLAVMEPDPRIARALLDHVATRRYNLHNTVWTGIFRELRRHGDVRTREALEALPVLGEEGSAGDTFRTRTKSAIDHLPSSLPQTDSDEKRIAAVRAAIDSLDLDLPSEAPKPAPAGRDEAALFAEMIANPQDDAVRLVLADVYTERGDVRGELITLQIRNERADKPVAKDQKREKQLLKEHLLHLLGPLEPVIDRKTCVFSRGFLQHAEVKFKTAAQKRELAENPHLSTLESIATREIPLIRKLPLVRTVSGASWKSLVELAHGEPMAKIHRVDVETTIADPGQVELERLDGLPSLEDVSFEVFGFGGIYNSTAWSWILDQAKGALGKLRIEIVTDLYRGGLGPALDELDRRPKIQWLKLRTHPNNASQAPEITFEIARKDGGYHVKIDGRLNNMSQEGIVRKGLTVEVHTPAKLVDEFHTRNLAALRELLGDRLVAAQ